MTDAKVDVSRVEHLFRYIREHGTLQDTGPTIGGFWTVEVWIHPDFPDLRAKLMDEGATMGISDVNIDCATTYGRDVQFYRGGAAALEDIYKRVFR